MYNTSSNWRPGIGLIGFTLIAVVIGAATGYSVAVAQTRNRCFNRYVKLCAKWFADNPTGEFECWQRADDVCNH